jgi:hypothetical protein
MASGSRPKRAASSKASARITDQYALNPFDQDEGERAYEDITQDDGGREAAHPLGYGFRICRSRLVRPTRTTV